MKNPPTTLTQIRGHLATLRLTAIEKALDDELAKAAQSALAPTQLVERLLAIEANARLERAMERRVKESKLPEHKLLSDFDFDFQTGIDKSQILELATLDFAARKQGLVLGGFPGTGKSHIAKALLLIGCTKQYRCRYTTASDMLGELFSGLADGSLAKKVKQYTAPEILLIDELGFDNIEQHDARNASLFFKVIDGRYGKASTLITTNIDFEQLGAYLGDPIITIPIVDRMVHHSITITIEGPSFRMHESKKLNAKTKKTSKPK
ncbi:ATP-binding protein [Candidatus Dependentiae bacterium]|nr:ATP-binding protein [Candidatus Dependentiae bacterium]